MKFKTISFVFMLLSCLAIMSCNKGDDDTNNSSNSKLDPQGDCFTALVDGELFESDNVTGTDVGIVLTLGATFGVGDVPTFGVQLFNRTEGTYTFDMSTGQVEVAATYSPGALTSTTIYGATTGSLTVTEHDSAGKRIKGTFNFEGQGTGEVIQVTEGFFDLGY